jgi:Tfp pilus assembly protein PilO
MSLKSLLTNRKDQTKAQEEKKKRSLKLKVQSVLIINLVLFCFLVVFSLLRFNEFRFWSQAEKLNNEQIDRLIQESAVVRRDFQIAQIEHRNRQSFMDEGIHKIFPPTEAYTELTRQLDNFFFELNSNTPPIIHNNLRFDTPQVSEDQKYMILPFSMSIQSSKDNFNRFLEYAAASGSLENPLRLIDIKNIQLSFAGNQQDFEMSFSVNAHAYFQNNQVQNNE